MKKNGFLVGMLGMALGGIVLTGCWTVPTTPPQDPVVYDTKQPKQEQSMIQCLSGVRISLFDGEKVKWDSKRDVLIPSGQHTLSYDYLSSVGRSSTTIGTMQITYYFEPGTVYRVSYVSYGYEAKPAIFVSGVFLEKLPSVSNEPTKFEGTWKLKGKWESDHLPYSDEFTEDGDFFHSGADEYIFTGNTVISSTVSFESGGFLGLGTSTFTQNEKSVFTFTDQTVMWQTFERSRNKEAWASTGIGINSREYKYNFQADCGLVLTCRDSYYTHSATYYKQN